MFKVTRYKNVKSTEVEATVDVEEVFKIIKEGDSYKKHIDYARSFERGSEDYDSVKTKLIPTFRFNFLFEGTASNKNITDPTGLIYIDVDNNDIIPESDFIFAKWKSISSMGWGILVKVQNISVENFNDYYDEVSLLLKIESDNGARKPTQQTVQSYDPKIYFNHDSKTFNSFNIKKVPSPIKLKKKKECLNRNETFLPINSNTKARFNNLDDYFNDNDLDYIVFSEEKEKLCIPFIPKNVNKGKRNQSLFIYLSQILALNPNKGKAYIKTIAQNINLNAMRPQLSDAEVQRTIDSLFKIKEANQLKIIYNKERRIIFNPKRNMSFKDKMQIVNIELGHIASTRTTGKIYECIEEWDFDNYGKISQLKLANLMQLSPSTVKRYWHNFKVFVKSLNDDYKDVKRNDVERESDCRINYSICDPLVKKSV